MKIPYESSAYSQLCFLILFCSVIYEFYQYCNIFCDKYSGFQKASD